MKNFLKDDQGAFLVFGVLAFVPLILMVGLTVDGCNFARAQRRVQQCVDTAAHAGIVRYAATSDTSKSQNLATQVFSVNATNIVGVGAPSTSMDTSANTLTVTASVTVPTYIMQLGGASSKTFTVSGTAQLQGNGRAEVAVIIDSSQNNVYWYPYFTPMITGLKNFINSLNGNVLVSFTPIHTSIQLDNTKLNLSNFLSKLSPTATEVLATSVYYPLNTNNVSVFLAPPSAYAFYTDNTTFPVKQSSSSSGAGLTWTSGGTWGGICLLNKCYPNYSYKMKPIAPILPLTQNKTLSTNYLTSLATWATTWTSVSDGLLSSLITWGWRTIDPSWSNTLATNSTSSGTSYFYGSYPKNYGSIAKYAILMVHDQNYWDAVTYDYDTSYIAYGYIPYYSSTACSSGNCSWIMSMYGMIPDTTSTTNFYSASCENFYYKSVDQFLGLGTSYINTAITQANNKSSQTYMNDAVAIINSQKFLTICQNMRNAGITLYVISAASNATNYGKVAVTTSDNAAYFSQCTGSSKQVYTGITTASAMTSTLQTIASAINTAAGTTSSSGVSTTVLSLITG